MTQQVRRSAIRLGVGERTADRTPVVVAVGDTREWRSRARPLPVEGLVKFADIEDITGSFLALNAPELVLSPLMARTFDCLDLAQLLAELGYTGRYRVVDEVIPDPALVAREVAAVAPGLDFGLISARDLRG